MVGSEGILISEACFAPGVDSSKVVQVPLDWANFISNAFLTLEIFD